MKGRIGLARRVHLIEQYKPDFWAASACKKWAGTFQVMPDNTVVTCRDCIGIDPEKVKVRQLESGPEIF